MSIAWEYADGDSWVSASSGRYKVNDDDKHNTFKASWPQLSLNPTSLDAIAVHSKNNFPTFRLDLRVLELTVSAHHPSPLDL